MKISAQPKPEWADDAFGWAERRIARLEAAVYMVKAKLGTARTEAGRAEFAAAASECPRAEKRAKSTHALIADAINVLTVL